MKILEENSLNYNKEDIIDAVSDELGFSMVRQDEDQGYFMLGNKIKLFVDFSGEIICTLKFPEKDVDVSDSTVQIEAYSTAIESAIQIVDIIRRMTEG